MPTLSEDLVHIYRRVRLDAYYSLRIQALWYVLRGISRRALLTIFSSYGLIIVSGISCSSF